MESGPTFHRDTGASSVDVWCEDCVEGLGRRLDPGSVDVVVTSPPYNLGTAYKKYDDTLARQDYVDWMGRWGLAEPQSARVLRVAKVMEETLLSGYTAIRDCGWLDVGYNQAME